MQIREKQISDITIIRPLEKRIDASSAPSFKGNIVDAINAGSRKLILDLSEVDFIDSSGLGSIVSSLKTIGPDGDLVICSIGSTVMSLFKLTRMDRIFRIFPTEDEAVRGISA